MLHCRMVKLKWHYFTRGLGAAMAVYGVLFDHSPERGTIIITGCGLAGFDSVARSDKGKKSDN